jgi:Xaa-Pro aminopeptidase
MIDEGLLGAHRSVQKLAYACAEEVGASLEAGVTEREAARRMRQWLEARGVDDWFHLPFAWFGERTAFEGLSSPLDFFPSDKKLARGMPFILDCAPVKNGVAADIGFTSALGPCPVIDKMKDDLLAHRSLIVDLVTQGVDLARVYAAVDALAEKQGYRNRHSKYPLGVLAHKVELTKKAPRRTLLGFGLPSLRSLGGGVIHGVRTRTSPFWSGGAMSRHPATPGLWAVEPHLGFHGYGAKFEELLVVSEAGARWLDDDLPHTRGRVTSRASEVAA